MAEVAASGGVSAPRKRRTVQACESCRSRKVRCSGTHPCTHCSRQNKACHFPQRSNRISVSERYFRQLQSAYESGRLRDESIDPPSQHPSPPASATASIADEDTPTGASQARSPTPSNAPASLSPADRTNDFTQNPLVDNEPFVLNSDGSQWFLGPSSTWSFSRRVIGHLEQYTRPSSRDFGPINLDGAAYTLPWPCPSDRQLRDTKDLPSLDHVIYIFNTFKFHLGQIFHFVEEEAFIQRLHAFYQDPQAGTNSSLQWLAQFFFILAFGKALLPYPDPGDRSMPKGWEYASRALAILPTFNNLQQDNLLSIEVYGLAALYLQSIDMRVTAFQYIGQALRLCYVVGIHRGCIINGSGRDPAIRCTNLWWSVYMLDQYLSALMGAPSAIQDSDISAPLPSIQDPSPRSAALALHVQLSQLLSKLMLTIYGVRSSLEGRFLLETQQVLRHLAKISRNIDDMWNFRGSGRIGRISRLSSHIYLYYHHCILLATRPVVMCILARHTENSTVHNMTQPMVLSDPVSSLLQACTDSSTAILKMLGSLKEDGLLETFLPFHLEQAFSSAFLLELVSAIIPGRIKYTSLKSTWNLILDSMITSGNNLAQLRKSELEHLSALLSTFKGASSGSGYPTIENVPENANEMSLSGDTLLDRDSIVFQDSDLNFFTDHGNYLDEVACGLDINNIASHIVFNVP